MTQNNKVVWRVEGVTTKTYKITWLTDKFDSDKLHHNEKQLLAAEQIVS